MERIGDIFLTQRAKAQGYGFQSWGWKSRVCSLCLLILAASACGGDDDAATPEFKIDACEAIGAKVINGDRCSPGRGTPIARLILSSQNGDISLCTGTVIDTNAILTAAHCVYLTSSPIDSIEVQVGPQVTYASRIAVHPGYREDIFVGALFNDVAVVFTREKLKAPTMPLLLSRSVERDEESVVTGFGTTENGEIGALFAGNTEITDVSVNHIFTTFDGTGSNPCTGDSGGPIFVDAGGILAIAGVVSTGNAEAENCGPGDVTLYTNLKSPEVSSFIREQVPNASAR